MCFKFIIWMINPMISLIEHDNDDDEETNKYYKLFTYLIVVLLNDIILEMNKLDDMTSDEYLLECNRLKSIYDRLKSN